MKAVHLSPCLEVKIPINGKVELTGELTIPEHAVGLVIFAHGSGSSRKSPRNRWVAEVLNQYRLATLLTDLLTDEEAANKQNIYDVEFLSGRVEQIVYWSKQRTDVNSLPLGLFGASTGAAAAIITAAKNPDLLSGVVSRGGRIDLAHEFLNKLRTPVLAIVGGKDELVVKLNREALFKVLAPHRLVIIPGATHLFEEAGCLEHVAEYSCDWFIDLFTVPKRTQGVGFGR